jgi:hypothetical protein
MVVSVFVPSGLRGELREAKAEIAEVSGDGDAGYDENDRCVLAYLHWEKAAVGCVLGYLRWGMAGGAGHSSNACPAAPRPPRSCRRA